MPYPDQQIDSLMKFIQFLILKRRNRIDKVEWLEHNSRFAHYIPKTKQKR